MEALSSLRQVFSGGEDLSPELRERFLVPAARGAARQPVRPHRDLDRHHPLGLRPGTGPAPGTHRPADRQRAPPPARPRRPAGARGAARPPARGRARRRPRLPGPAGPHRRALRPRSFLRPWRARSTTRATWRAGCRTAPWSSLAAPTSRSRCGACAIEPGEVEAALARHPAVARGGRGSRGRRLTAWIVAPGSPAWIGTSSPQPPCGTSCGAACRRPWCPPASSGWTPCR